jgi:hypothetical protein
MLKAVAVSFINMTLIQVTTLYYKAMPLVFSN